MDVNNLLFSQNHLWIKVDNKEALIGISGFAQEQLGEAVYIELPEVNTKLNAGETFGSIESAKTISELVSPLSGEVAEINTELSSVPGLVNKSPFEDGWLIKVKFQDEAQIKDLMNRKAYEELISKSEK